ncbi:MAG: DUF1549 domain-containing protein, partial [Planctomycetaceae bacterium]|nr:DUF1549 domain-containing protein [Planctomycetaceae bacterium]
MTRFMLAFAVLSCTQLSLPAIVRGDETNEKVDFNRDVLPILSDRCFVCHGPDAGRRQADLRLDIREEALAAGAFVPGKPDKSELVARIFFEDPDIRMPPKESAKTLSEKEKRILQRWVAEGAEYRRHWSFEPPVKAEIPSGQHPVDALVNRTLQRHQLSMSPEADRRTLIRRLYADLLGLPPTPEEVDEFLADDSPQAWESLVDRVLANPHYGERMAIGWLDVVRFADTIGYHSDNPRNVWPYRDWVIRSFNENKPFDRFTIEQVAGDLVPDADQQTRVASAFNRLLLSTEEGGAQPKDYEARMLTDRVRAVGAAWLGLATGCAQCHDHKFDPFRMRDFYSLGAFFADIKEPILGRREDGMVVAPTEDEQKLADLDAALQEARGKFEAVTPQLDAAQRQWEHDVAVYDVTLPELRAESTASDAEKQQAKQVSAALKKEAEKRNRNEQNIVQSYFRDRVDHAYRAEATDLSKAEQQRNNFYNSLVKCLVSVSTPQKRIVRILPRGNWMDDSGEVVQPALPAFLLTSAKSSVEPEQRELTRLDLGRWLVTRDNPLTARTVMNRMWKQFFGTGISRVLDDLGAQGEPPVHPELLD